eukprot:CAMPEP_0172577348 /NCGR_PEP_ID=MMETSP1067-20121228/138183_1 /TAXON_ID=265564 ORGANISM="Thalassiosira punctigera, Strain Tpunct2005C2" /NCGR_SAMPLE_ID=MMETSP1067 /ASSEMBLY_ACC=CAM_ASM_000444 /LENGTH=141 /DNA_ID=CAMNT_0013370035 /DNA_START=730 /DNA_END=1155 /DNA_ORIENTATION=-
MTLNPTVTRIRIQSMASRSITTPNAALPFSPRRRPVAVGPSLRPALRRIAKEEETHEETKKRLERKGPEHSPRRDSATSWKDVSSERNERSEGGNSYTTAKDGSEERPSRNVRSDQRSKRAGRERERESVFLDDLNYHRDN